jgi:SAM-dependent methyltransferase
MIFNSAFESSRIEYSYDSTLSYSPAFRRYTEVLAKRLVAEYCPNDKDIVEIGCENGEFLDRLCGSGRNRGIGFDPAAASRTTRGLPEIVPDAFGRSERSKAADFLCCRHVLEHIETPHDLLEAVRKCLAPRGGAAYFEVPNANSVLDGPTTWDIIYPHCLYFTVPSLHYLFRSSGFQIAQTETTFGDQFLAIEVRPSGAKAEVRPDTKAVAAVIRLADQFEKRLRDSIFRWSRFIEYASVEGCRIVLWGEGAKSVTFLNVIPGAERLLAVVDGDPRKQHTFIPGTGQPVISPERLPHYNPDVVIVLNPLSQSEIQESVWRLGIEPLVTMDARLPLPSRARRANAATG